MKLLLGSAYVHNAVGARAGQDRGKGSLRVCRFGRGFAQSRGSRSEVRSAGCLDHGPKWPSNAQKKGVRSLPCKRGSGTGCWYWHRVSSLQHSSQEFGQGNFADALYVNLHGGRLCLDRAHNLLPAPCGSAIRTYRWSCSRNPAATGAPPIQEQTWRATKVRRDELVRSQCDSSPHVHLIHTTRAGLFQIND